MKPHYYLAALLFLSACTATEKPNEEAPEKENYYPDTPKQDPPVPAPDTMPMKDTFASAANKKQDAKQEKQIKF